MFIEQIKEFGGSVKFSDRMKLTNNRDERPRWVAFVTVFAHDVSGEGATKEKAALAAICDLPEFIRRHFHGISYDLSGCTALEEDTRRGNRKRKSNPMTELEAMLSPEVQRHLVKWLEHSVFEDERDEILERIARALAEEPDLVERSFTWREIADRGR